MKKNIENIREFDRPDLNNCTVQKINYSWSVVLTLSPAFNVQNSRFPHLSLSILSSP